MAGQPSGKLAQVTGPDVSIDPAKHYDDWADTYESDLLGSYGYCAHEIAVSALAELVPDRTATLIDVGCGTGLVGAELAAKGFSRIDGVDISEGMIAKAAARGLYRTLITGTVGEGGAPLGASYDAVICVGSFGLGHLGPEAMRALSDLAREGGHIVIFMNAEPYELEDYESHIREMERGGVWTVIRIEDHNYMQALDRPGKLILARRG